VTDAIRPERLADTVRRRVANSPCDLNAYWMRVAENREAYADELGLELRDEPVVVLVIRDTRFTNPNAILAEFVEVVAQNKELCEQRLDRSCEKCAFVLLSRTELAIPQISSPVVLPAWFPLGGGGAISMLIEDLTWTADAPLGASEVRIGDLCECLLALEETFVARVSIVREVDHRRTNAFLDLVRRDPAETLEGILDAANEHRTLVTTPIAFRPSLRDGRTLIARLWAVAQERQPEDMKGPSKALATALDLPNAIELVWHESISSVLRRPSGGEPPEQLRFARNVLMTVATACQLITAAAHADAYAHYPVPLLRSLSLDLRRSLTDAETVIGALAG
jgi:hypothetical protein